MRFFISKGREMKKFLLKGICYIVIAYFLLVVFHLIPDDFGILSLTNSPGAAFNSQKTASSTSPDTKFKKIALTFDDGYKLNDQKITLLEKYTAQGMGFTFFLVGGWIQRHPDVFERLKNNSSIELGNHSATHSNFLTLSSEQIKTELTSVEAFLGSSSHKLVRFPYGKPCGHNLAPCPPTVGTKGREVFDFVTTNLGFKVIGWNISTADHENTTSTNDIVQRIKNGVNRGGNIVLLHTQGRDTFQALEIIIPWLLENSYFPTTVSCVLGLTTCS